MLSLVGIAPHPAIIIPKIGRNELSKVQSTVAGMRELAELFKKEAVELLVVITPHGLISSKGPSVLTEKYLSGDFGQFGFPSIRVEFETDEELLKLLGEEFAEEALKPVFLTGNSKLDHGSMVPLYYLQEAGLKVPGLNLTFGFNTSSELYRFGQILRRAIDQRGLKTAVLASGDLSHRLTPSAPAGFNPRGKEYDDLLVELLDGSRVEEILNLDPDLIEEAGECGYRSFVIALGALHGAAFKTDILSYEGPFGVGYLVASLRPLAAKNSLKSSPVKLARQVLEDHFFNQKSDLSGFKEDEYFKTRAGAFVTLKKEGRLRGCIGTVEPARGSLFEEIKKNAVAAAVRDPRFASVQAEELKSIELSVDVLSPLEKIAGIGDLDPKKYGVLVKSGGLSGLLLPALEGIDTPEKQVSVARQKAGIKEGQPLLLYRFTVKRYEE